jgi:hypothetical protein
LAGPGDAIPKPVFIAVLRCFSCFTGNIYLAIAGSGISDTGANTVVWLEGRLAGIGRGIDHTAIDGIDVNATEGILSKCRSWHEPVKTNQEEKAKKEPPELHCALVYQRRQKG